MNNAETSTATPIPREPHSLSISPPARRKYRPAVYAFPAAEETSGRCDAGLSVIDISHGAAPGVPRTHLDPAAKPGRHRYKPPNAWVFGRRASSSFWERQASIPVASRTSRRSPNSQFPTVSRDSGRELGVYGVSSTGNDSADDPVSACMLSVNHFARTTTSHPVTKLTADSSRPTRTATRSSTSWQIPLFRPSCSPSRTRR